MPWRGHHAKICHGCERHVSECGKLSARYKCKDCGDGNHIAEVHQMRAHNGPYWQHWRKRMAACVGGVLVDERHPAE